MSTAKRSPFVAVFIVLLVFSGWIAAALLSYRGSQQRELTPPIRPPPRTAPIAPAPTPPTNPGMTVSPQDTPFDRLFRTFAEHSQLAGSLVAFCLLDEEGRTIFASPLAGTALCPASALKTLTTGAAFDILGPDFRFETALAATAPLDAGGALAGDLVLVGGGDPTFAQEDLAQLADAAVAAGLKRVAGKLRIDASIFPDDPMNEHWNWGDIGNGYGAGAFGLNLDHNRIAIRLQPGAEPGDPARFLDGAPVPRDVQWKNRVVTGPPRSGDQTVIYSEPFGRLITLRGSVPAGAGEFTVSGANPDPPALAAELLRTRLESAGVRFADGPGPFPAAERTVLARHQSAPLPEIIDHTHAASDNLEAQCFFLTIGLRQGAAPADAVREYWEKAGVAFTGLRLIDGNGLARANMIRPLDLARVNFATRRGPHGQRFFESLGTYAQGHARGKIGGMSGVKTQVGFLRTAQDRELTYALMGNGLAPGREFWRWLEELLEAVRAVEL